MISEKCRICTKPDLRRLIELGWNAKMSAAQLAAVFGGVPTAPTIVKHLKEHVDEGAWNGLIPVPDEKPVRERILALQRAQLDEIERRIQIAKQRAEKWNEEMKDVEGFEERDWSYYFNLLDKDMQAAISSILKSQGLSDKREATKQATGVELYKLMLGGDGGLSPKRLTEGPVVDGEAVEVDA